MSNRTVDAVVIGGGHHGLVAANVLADAGWGVCLLEAAGTVGGAVRSAELHPGFTADLYSAFYRLPCCGRWSWSGTGCAGRTPRPC